MTRAVLVVGVALFLWPQLVLGQGVDAPRGGVFGGGPATTTGGSRLDVTATVSQALDSETLPELQSRIQQGDPQSGGYSSMLIASANYERLRRRTQVAGTAFSAFRYYQRLDQVSSVTHSAGLGGTVRLSSRSTLEMNQTAAYSPSYLYQLFPSVAPPAVGDAIPAAPDYRVDQTQSYSYNSTATFAVGRARGHRASLTAERTSTDFRGGSDRPDLDVVAGRAKWSHGVGRTGAFSAEYEYREGEFGFGGTGTEQRLRMGGEYSPALSVSRRAHFRFSLAPSSLHIPESATNAETTGTVYKLEGDVSAEYPFLRSWALGGGYRRGLEYIPVLHEPVFNDSARVELRGLVSRRLDVSAAAGYAVGQSALNRTNKPFDTYTGTIRARYGVARSFALYAEWLYYYYNLHGQAALAPDLPSTFQQHGLRVGLMLWARPVDR